MKLYALALEPGMLVYRFGQYKEVATVTPRNADGYPYLRVTYVNSPEYSDHYQWALIEVGGK